MRIRDVRVENFRSLRNVSLSDIGNLTILIGGNSSGKSNLLEALYLFFNEIDPSPQREIGPVSDYIWFNRIPRKPVRITITLGLTKDELEELLPEKFSDTLKLNEGENVLSIVREIEGAPNAAVWKTTEVKINNILIMKNGKFVFTSSSLTAEKKKRIGESILQNIHRKFKGAFKLINAARNVPSHQGQLGGRTSFIDPRILGELTKLGQSLDPSEEEKWIKIMEHVQEVSPQIRDMRIMASQLTIREHGSNRHFPISLMGGGHQEISALLYEIIKEENCVYGIEEPELHLHPQLARQFFGALKKISQEKQIFITTHSTIFVDQSDLTNTWIVKKEKGETKITRIKEAKALRNVLWELGVRPSDVFYADVLIFVEGPTEKIVFPILARKIGINLDIPGISFIPIYGKSCGRYHLKVWTEAVKNVQIPFFMIFDKDAVDEAKEYEKKGILKVGENLFILKKGAIEEYYPNDKLIQALKSEYDIEISEEEEKEIMKSPREENIKKFLQKKLQRYPSGWKVKIGQKVAELMTEDEIDNEIKRIIERIATKLRLYP